MLNRRLHVARILVRTEGGQPEWSYGGTRLSEHVICNHQAANSIMVVAPLRSKIDSQQLPAVAYLHAWERELMGLVASQKWMISSRVEPEVC